MLRLQVTAAKYACPFHLGLHEMVLWRKTTASMEDKPAQVQTSWHGQNPQPTHAWALLVCTGVVANKIDHVGA